MQNNDKKQYLVDFDIQGHQLWLTQLFLLLVTIKVFFFKLFYRSMDKNITRVGVLLTMLSNYVRYHRISTHWGPSPWQDGPAAACLVTGCILFVPDVSSWSQKLLPIIHLLISLRPPTVALKQVQHPSCVTWHVMTPNSYRNHKKGRKLLGNSAVNQALGLFLSVFFPLQTKTDTRPSFIWWIYLKIKSS